MLTLPITLLLLAAIAVVAHGALARVVSVPEPVFLGEDGFGGA